MTAKCLAIPFVFFFFSFHKKQKKGNWLPHLEAHKETNWMAQMRFILTADLAVG